MPTASLKKKINCSKEKIINIVLDIEKYPEFVPWCLNGKIHKKKEDKGILEITADLTIGKGFFKDTYRSFVIYDKAKNSIKVSNLGGPLKNLENNWFFKELEGFCEVNFYIDFELKNKFLNYLMKKSFKIGLDKISNSFEKRTQEI